MPERYPAGRLAFDVGNRVTSVGLSGGLTCGYRSDGLRAWKQDNQGVRTYFLYDGGNPILELDSAGAVKNVNVFAPDGLMARKEGSSWTYYTFDPQGNVLNKLDASESVTAGRLLDAWGQGVETALYLCQHRMYDASAGRWLNRDPIGIAGGMNLYGYCAGGPVGSVDPWGFYGTGSFWGDAGQILLGVGDALGLTHVPSAAEVAMSILDPGGIGRLNADFLSDPQGFVQSAVDSYSFWDTDDPREFGGRFARAGLALYGACELAGLKTGHRVYEHGFGERRSTYRKRHWKSRAQDPASLKEFGAAGVMRMKDGLAPQRANPMAPGGVESKELAHVGTPYSQGGTSYIELWPQEHALIDPFRRPGY